MHISVIIPTYNGKKLLEQSLPLLIDSLKFTNNFEILVIDNNSTDDTEAFVKTHYPNIYYKNIFKNKGFTAAVNIGAKLARGQYLLFLNNDCLLEKDTVRQLYHFLEDEQKYVATQPIVYDRKKEIENVGYFVNLEMAKAFPVTNLEVLKKGYPKKGDNKIYGLSATCLLIKKEIFDYIGMFDESFHSYLEDVDLFIRLNKNGYHYSPLLSASCVHFHMSTSKKMGFYKEYHDFANWIRIIFKNYSISFIIKHFPWLLVERLKNLSGILKKMVKFNDL